jgi:hypothetical protein
MWGLRRGPRSLLPTVLRCCYEARSVGAPGCRRPKAKYETGTTPAELTTVTTVAHSHFGPRTWLAGRRLRSTSAAILRMPSATAAPTSNLRVRSPRSLHCVLAAMTSLPGKDPDAVHATRSSRHLPCDAPPRPLLCGPRDWSHRTIRYAWPCLVRREPRGGAEQPCACATASTGMGSSPSSALAHRGGDRRAVRRRLDHGGRRSGAEA